MQHLFNPPQSYSDREQRIFDFLNEVRIGVLSTVTPNNEPHGVVIYYSIDPSFEVRFLTKKETQKFDNLSHNDHVMLTVFDSQTQATAQVHGIAQEIHDPYEINQIARTVLETSQRTSDAGLPPISKLVNGGYAGVRIIPAQIRMAVYARPDPGEYVDLFETLEHFNIDPTPR